MPKGMQTAATRRRLTTDEYQRMGEAGILHEDERVELIEGELVALTPIGSEHMGAVIRVSKWFERAIGDRVLVSVQNPVRLSVHSEPLPDVVLLRLRDDFYTGALPGAADVLLLVEVADTSLRYDRNVKLPLYAQAGIVEVWIVDARRRRVTAYRDPSPEGYRQTLTLTRRATLAPLAFPDLTLRWEDIFG